MFSCCEWSEQHEGESLNGGKSGKVSVGIKKRYCNEGLEVKKLMEVSLKVGHSSDASYCSAQLRCLQALQLSLSPEENAHLHSSLTSSFCPRWSEFKPAHQLELQLHLLPADVHLEMRMIILLFC